MTSESRASATFVAVFVVVAALLGAGGFIGNRIYRAVEHTPEEQRIMERSADDALCGSLTFGDRSPAAWFGPGGTLALDAAALAPLSMTLIGQGTGDSPIEGVSEAVRSALLSRADAARPLSPAETEAVAELSNWYEATC